MLKPIFFNTDCLGKPRRRRRQRCWTYEKTFRYRTRETCPKISLDIPSEQGGLAFFWVRSYCLSAVLVPLIAGLDPAIPINLEWMNGRRSTASFIYTGHCDSNDLVWYITFHSRCYDQFHILYIHTILHTFLQPKRARRFLLWLYTIWEGRLAPIWPSRRLLYIRIRTHWPMSYYISSDLSWKQTEQLMPYIPQLLSPPSPLRPPKNEIEEQTTQKKEKNLVLACNSIRAKKHLFLIEPLHHRNDLYVTLFRSLFFFHLPFARQEVRYRESICQFYDLARDKFRCCCHCHCLLISILFFVVCDIYWQDLLCLPNPVFYSIFCYVHLWCRLLTSLTAHLSIHLNICETHLPAYLFICFWALSYPSESFSCTNLNPKKRWAHRKVSCRTATNFFVVVRIVFVLSIIIVIISGFSLLSMALLV